MKKGHIKVLLKSGRGLSGLYDLTITVSPEQLKNPPLTEEWIDNPKDANHNPLYDNKPVMKQPLSNPDRSIDRGQIVGPATNRNLKYSKTKKVLLKDKNVFIKSDITPMVDDEPNQWNINDGDLYWDDLAKNSVKSIKVYAPEQNPVQYDPRLYQTNNKVRPFHNDPTLDTKKVRSEAPEAQNNFILTYPRERVEDNKLIRFQDDAFNLMDDKAPSSDKSQRNNSPRLSNGKNIL